jgi:hypothetical protein
MENYRMPTIPNPLKIRVDTPSPFWNRATRRALVFFLLCVAFTLAVTIYLHNYKNHMDSCASNVIQAAHTVQDFAKAYGYKPGDKVVNLWPRLYLYMEDQYKQGRLKSPPIRVCPDTGQEYECTNIIPEPGTPVILCQYPPHRASIKITHD